MVLICGYGAIAPTTLPHNGAIEYVIKPALRDIKMLQRTKLLAKSSEICVTAEYAEYIPKDYADKRYVCDTIPQLISHLNGEDSVQQVRVPVECVTHVSETVEQDSANTVTLKRQRRQAVRKAPITSKHSTATVNVVQDTKRLTQIETENKDLITSVQHLTTVNAELTERVQQLETDNTQLNSTVQQLESDLQTSSDNAEVLEAEVAALQQTVMQKESAYADIELRLKQTVDELNAYKQDTDITALQEQVDDLNYTVDMLRGEADDYKTKVADLTTKLETERRQFEADKEQYATIIDQYETERKANGLSEVFSNFVSGVDLHKPISPSNAIDTTGVRVLCFANDAGNIYDNIRNTITSGNLNAVVADFSGNRSLSARLKLPADKGVQKLISGTPVSEVAVTRGKTQIIPAENMYDIQLLGIQWSDVIARLREFAQGRPVYILLGSINTFSTRYTAMLLSQKQPAYFISAADPDSVLNLYWQLSTLNATRLNLILTEYVPGTLKSLLDAVVARYNTTFVKKGTQFHLETLN